MKLAQARLLRVQRAGDGGDQHAQDIPPVLRLVKRESVAMADLEDRPERQEEQQGHIDQGGQNSAGTGRRTLEIEMVMAALPNRPARRSHSSRGLIKSSLRSGTPACRLVLSCSASRAVSS